MSRPDENKMSTRWCIRFAGLPRRFPILILGSFPSVKSRRPDFYGHPQNRFWKVTAAVCGKRCRRPWKRRSVSAPESYRCLGCDRVLRHHRLERCEHPRCCAESAAGHSGMRRYPADLLQRGDRVEVLPEVPGEAAGTGSGSPSVDESRERRMVCGAAVWRVEPVRRSLTKRRVTG